MPSQDRADYDFLRANGQAAKAMGSPYVRHLDQPIGVWNYIRIANDIVQAVSPQHLLDWGCGFGQMTYLLRQRGFTVVPFDVGPPDARLPDIPLCQSLGLVRAEDRTVLPFEDASFDAVLSCGVLEHVDEHGQPGDETRSLLEIARVLRPGGTFFIFQLPQSYAWQEALIRRYKLGYAHPRRYTAPEITHMLSDAGFRVRRIRRANLIPKNLTGMPERLRTLYSTLSRPLLTLDTLLCRLPLVNQAAGVLEVMARPTAGEAA